MTDIAQNSGTVAPDGNGQPAGHPAGPETINGREVITIDRKQSSLLSDEARAEFEAWRALEQQDAQNAAEGRAKLEAEFGYEAENVRRVAKTFFDSLGEDTRSKLEERLQNGNTRLNDPDTIAELAFKGLESIPPLKALLPQFGGDERAAIEHLMQFRHGPYFKGPYAESLQLKYRTLLRG